MVFWATALAGTSTMEVQPISDEAEHDSTYNKAVALIAPHVRLAGRPPLAMTESARGDLTQGIAYLQAVIRFNPRNWAAFWIEGKAYQALGENQAANSALQTAYSLQPQNADVAREYAESCMALGFGKQAVDASRQAITLSPRDAGLRANLALAYLLAGRNQDAMEAIKAALAMDPADEISRRVKKTIDEVLTGKRRQPHDLSDLGGG